MAMRHETKEEIVIEGVREDGRHFRPSDWIERLGTVNASFGPDHRLRYDPNVQPCMVEGQKCLVVNRDLEQDNPALYFYLIDFARDNHLRMHTGRGEPVAADAQRDEHHPVAA